MAIKTSAQLEAELIESGKRLKQVRDAAEANRERQREGEPSVIPTAQTPLASRGGLRGKD